MLWYAHRLIEPITITIRLQNIQKTAVFEELGCTVAWHLGEGDDVDPAAMPDGKVGNDRT